MEAYSPYKFAGTQLTVKSIEETKRHYIGLAQSIIDDVTSGRLWCNDVSGCVQAEKNFIQQMESAKHGELPRVTFTFLQRAHFLQTGEDIALLP